MIRHECIEIAHDAEPDVHLLAGIVDGVDAVLAQYLQHMRRAPRVFLRVHPFEVVGGITPAVAVLMVALGAFAVGIDRSRSMEYGADVYVALYIPKIPHMRRCTAGNAVVGYPAGYSVGGSECVVNLPQPFTGKGKEMHMRIYVQSLVRAVLGVDLGSTEQEPSAVVGVGDDAVIGSQEVGMILDDSDFRWSAWLVFFLLLHCCDDCALSGEALRGYPSPNIAG